MSRLSWRWEERDFGFRFRAGKRRQAGEYSQTRIPDEFYVVPASQRKLTKDHIEKLAQLAVAHTSPRVVTSLWPEYDRDWDWIVSEDGMCLNWAGCMEGEEINRREDEGVQRPMELIAAFVERDEPVTLALQLLTQVHVLGSAQK